MRCAAHPKGINIVAESFRFRIERRIHGTHSARQHAVLVDTLSARHYFLAPHEGVVGVSEARIGRGEMSVERAGGDGIVSEEVEVCAVLVVDEATEEFFVGRADGGQYCIGAVYERWKGTKEREREDKNGGCAVVRKGNRGRREEEKLRECVTEPNRKGQEEEGRLLQKRGRQNLKENTQPKHT